MNKSEEYDGSDSSDEDFCPEKAAVAGDSEAASEDEELLEEEDEDPVAAMPNKSARGRKKKLKKNPNGRKATAKEIEDESEEEEKEHTDAPLTIRRSTRQMDENNKNSTRFSAQEKDELESEEDEQVKSRSDALWADFLGEVKPPTVAVTKLATNTPSGSVKKTAETKSSANCNKMDRDTETNKLEKQTTEQETVEETPKLVTVTEICDFAGEEVRVQKTVSASSIKENKLSPSAASASSPRTSFKRAGAGGAGLGSILNQIGKKKKISVLEKSQLDWNSFKQDEGIDEQLQTHNKGKDGYLERQDFLQRTDLRQFEIEKNLRQSRRNQ